jgi:hypothetical protein
MVRPLTGFGPSTETPSGAAVPHCSRPRSRAGFRAPPLRFFTPSAFEDQRIGKCFRTTRPGLPTKRLPTSVFRRPSWASSSLTPAALFHAAAAHGVSTLQSFSLRSNSTRLVTWRSPPGVSSGSRKSWPHPQGFLSERNPCPRWEYCIPLQTDALLGFIASAAFLRSGLGSSLDGPSAHDL